MPRYAKRTDDNHSAVVEELRSVLHDGTVLDASGAGNGFPDLVIGWKGRNYLVELKDPGKPPSRRKLTTAQVGLHQNWQGQIAVCHSAAEIMATIAREAAA